MARRGAGAIWSGTVRQVRRGEARSGAVWSVGFWSGAARRGRAGLVGFGIVLRGELGLASFGPERQVWRVT